MCKSYKHTFTHTLVFAIKMFHLSFASAHRSTSVCVCVCECSILLIKYSHVRCRAVAACFLHSIPMFENFSVSHRIYDRCLDHSIIEALFTFSLDALVVIILRVILGCKQRQYFWHLCTHHAH